MGNSNYMTQEEWDAWPNCSVTGCVNKCCLRLHSTRCYPHTLGLPVNFLAAETLTRDEPAKESA